MRILSSASPEPRDAFGRAARNFSIEALSEGPVAELVREALRQSGKLAQRRSPLQPLFVLWFLLCRPLYSQDSLDALFDRLVLALRGRIPRLPCRAVTRGALCHARDRLGVEPVRLLLHGLADSLPPAPLFHGRRVGAVDGVRLDLPDTVANEHAFGRRRGRRGASPWPQMLLLVWVDAFTRIARDAVPAPCRASEQVVARSLFESLDGRDLLLLDKGFYGLPTFQEVARRGAAFLCPVPRHVRLKPRGPVRVDGPVCDYAARITSRAPLPDGRCPVRSMDVRVIEVRRPGFRRRRFVTNLPPSVPAREIVPLYAQRWEAELAFDEMKTVLCHRPAGAAPTHLRSRTPDGARQEAFALLCAHALVRRTMARAAEAAGLAPTELGFTHALRVICHTALIMAAVPATRLVDLYNQMLRDLAACRVLRPPSPRRCPRAVKRKCSKYPLKKTTARRAA